MVKTATYGGKVTMNDALRVDYDAVTQFFICQSSEDSTYDS